MLVTVTAEASALKHRNSSPDHRWHIRQWQAPTRGSWWPATVIVTAPQRQWPVIAELERLVRGASLDPSVIGCMLVALKSMSALGQPARRGGRLASSREVANLILPAPISGVGSTLPRLPRASAAAESALLLSTVESIATCVQHSHRMSKFLKSLSLLVRGDADPSSKLGVAERDTGPSTLTTPLFPLTGSDTDSAGTQPPLVTLPALHKGGRKTASSRALNAAGRATTQVALSTHVEPTSVPKVARPSHRSSVVLTETERLRLQIMQVQLKLTGLELYTGSIDGMVNPDLVDAVRHFQVLKGMRDTGILTAGTLSALGIRTVA